MRVVLNRWVRLKSYKEESLLSQLVSPPDLACFHAEDADCHGGNHCRCPLLNPVLGERLCDGSISADMKIAVIIEVVECVTDFIANVRL